MTHQTHIRLRAVQPVQYARKHHAPGAVFAVDAQTAQALITGGDAGPVEGEGALEPEANAGTHITGTGDPGAGAPPAPDGTDDAGGANSDAANSARQAALIAAIATLEPGHSEHWTQAGRPEIRALAARTGLRDISAAERDVAWERAQATKEGAEEGTDQTSSETGAQSP